VLCIVGHVVTCYSGVTALHASLLDDEPVVGATNTG